MCATRKESQSIDCLAGPIATPWQSSSRPIYEFFQPQVEVTVIANAIAIARPTIPITASHAA